AAKESLPDCELLAATGVETESDVPFATLQALLWPLRDQVGEIEEGQAALLRGIVELGPVIGASTFSVGAAPLALLSVAAEQRPVTAVVDDVQWADEASQDVLCFVGRRVEREAIAIIAGLREGEQSPFADERSFQRLEVQSLAREPARALLVQASP